MKRWVMLVASALVSVPMVASRPPSMTVTLHPSLAVIRLDKGPGKNHHLIV